MIVDYHVHLRAPDGSRDHTVEGVERFAEAAADARSAGYDSVTVFDRRQRRQEPLG